MAELIGLREAGRRLGVSDTSVRKAIATGRISVAGRTDSGRPLLDWADVQARWGDVDPARQTYRPPPIAPERPPPSPAQPEAESPSVDEPSNYLASRAQKEFYAAKLEQIKYEQQVGKLVELEIVGKAVEDAFTRVRQRLLAIPNAAAPDLLGMATVGEIEGVLAPYVREALDELVSAYG